MIGLATEKVLDVSVRQKSCTACKRKESHSTCYKNHTGSSGSMEVNGILEMMNRSLNSNLRYTTYIGDGDSSVEAAIKTEVPYGPIVTKIDCLNHKIKVKYLYLYCKPKYLDFTMKSECAVSSM